MVSNFNVFYANNVVLYFTYTGSLLRYSGTLSDAGYLIAGLRKFGSEKEALHYCYSNALGTKGMGPKLLKAINEKIDDEKRSNGRVRVCCYRSKYWI